MTRNKNMNIRISEEELKLVDDFAVAHGMSRTDAIIYSITNLNNSIDTHRKLNVIIDKLEKIENLVENRKK